MGQGDGEGTCEFRALHTYVNLLNYAVYLSARDDLHLFRFSFCSYESWRMSSYGERDLR